MDFQNNRPSRLAYRSKDGIFWTHFTPPEEPNALFDLIRTAERWSDDRQNSNREIRLLDTFFSDEADSMMLKEILKSDARRQQDSNIRILFADPSSYFARARIGTLRKNVPQERIKKGLAYLLKALGRTERDLEQRSLQELVDSVREFGRPKNLEIKFYSDLPGGPLYFFNDILLAGRFAAGRDCSETAWFMIVNDPSHANDLYDQHSSEFEQLWENAIENPKEDWGIEPSQGLVISSTQERAEPVDLGLVVATDTEWDVIHSVRGMNWATVANEPGLPLLIKGIYEKDGKRLTIVATRQSNQGLVSAAVAATRLTSLFDISYLASVGICAAIPGEAEMGQIIAAESMFNYQAGKMADGSFFPNADSLSTSHHVVNLLREFGKDYAQMADSFWVGDRPNSRPTCRVGKVASGSQVVADANVVQAVKRQARNCIGIDMEGFAVFQTAQEMSVNGKPVAMFVKAASDYADPAKADSIQRYCAFISFQFVVNFTLDKLIS